MLYFGGLPGAPKSPILHFFFTFSKASNGKILRVSNIWIVVLSFPCVRITFHDSQSYIFEDIEPYTFLPVCENSQRLKTLLLKNLWKHLTQNDPRVCALFRAVHRAINTTFHTLWTFELCFSLWKLLNPHFTSLSAASVKTEP